MIPVCSETQNNMENIRNKWYEIVENTPKELTNKLIIRGRITTYGLESV